MIAGTNDWRVACGNEDVLVTLLSVFTCLVLVVEVERTDGDLLICVIGSSLYCLGVLRCAARSILLTVGLFANIIDASSAQSEACPLDDIVIVFLNL